MSAYKSDYDRLLATVMREFEREVEQMVAGKYAQVFAALRAGEEVEIPVIGGALPPPEYRTPEYYDELQAEIIQALRSQKWFTFEAPAWAQPLPLRREDCEALGDTPDRWGRDWLRGEYGQHLRSLSWHYERAIPFEKFCAQKYNTGSKPTYGVRKRGRPRKLWAPNRRMI
jgi:hypothetical protein